MLLREVLFSIHIQKTKNIKLITTILFKIVHPL